MKHRDFKHDKYGGIYQPDWFFLFIRAGFLLARIDGKDGALTGSFINVYNLRS